MPEDIKSPELMGFHIVDLWEDGPYGHITAVWHAITGWVATEMILGEN